MSLSFTHTVSFEVMKIRDALRSVVSSISCRVRVPSPFAIEVMWVPCFSQLPSKTGRRELVAVITISAPSKASSGLDAALISIANSRLIFSAKARRRASVGQKTFACVKVRTAAAALSCISAWALLPKTATRPEFFPGQILGADTTRGSRSKFVDRTVLKQYERLAGFRTVEDNRFVMQLSFQIRLQIGSHDAMDRTWQEAKNHPIGVMDSPAGQIEPPTERHFFEGVFDGHDYLVHGDDLIDGGVFEEEHVTRG